MQPLKLKQACAVLQVDPKQLQNLVQFGVVKPKRFQGLSLFDFNALLSAQVAFHLKDSLGTSTSALIRLMNAFRTSTERRKVGKPKYLVFTCRLALDEEPVKLSVPVRALAERIEERMSRVNLYKDLPPGRKRRGWEREFFRSLAGAARDIGDISEEEILRAVRGYRRERQAPQIAVAAEI